MNGLANFAALDLDQLYAKAKESLCDIRRNKNLLSAFIAHSPAKFFGL
jgi:hypothetical protein